MRQLPGFFMSFRFIEHTADIAFEVESKTLAGLFKDSALALREAACEIKKENGIEKLTIECSEDTLELLLVEFLNELNFLIHTKKWIFNSIQKIDIVQTGNKFHFNCQLSGGKINSNNCELKVEIKAVIFHQMKIEKRKDKFFTRIVLDT